MSFFKSIVICALFAGLAAGTTLTVLQTLKVYPLIFAAEKFENPAGHSDDSSGDSSEEASAGDDEEWMPADGAERLYFSLQSNVLIGVGLGLVLSAIFAVRGINNWRQGVMWGLAGFVAINLAPSVGLAPELPGMPAADLFSRQVWWWGTALATAIGLALIFISGEALWRVAGVVLIMVPHIIGAPHLDTIESDVPAILAADFATATMAANMIFWVVLGTVAAMIFNHLNKDTPPAAV